MTATRRQFLTASAAVVAGAGLAVAAKDEVPFTVIVLDPLAKDLSCPCVAGYGQRDYTELGKYLSGKLGKTIHVHFNESLTGALTKKTAGRADLIIGKDSVLRAQALENNLTVTKLASLTGKDGETTQTGLLVVASTDPVISADNLKGYRILFGSEQAEEKNAAPKLLLKDLNISYVSDEKDIAASCSVCATKLVDFGKTNEKVCGVISSYALPLLEGCGTIKKGDLKVVGTTDPVPFISAYTTGSVPADLQKTLLAALLAVGKNETLCTVLETKSGFVEPTGAPVKKK